MLWQRYLTAIIGIPLGIVIVYYGKLPFLITIIILSLLALYEYFAMLKRLGLKPNFLLGYIAVVALLYAVYLKNADYILGIMFAYFVCSSIAYITLFPRLSVRDLASSFLGVFYAGVLFGHAILIRNNLANGFWWFICILVLTWVNDSGAFFVGSKIGRIKLHGLVSPKKTIEGAIGGVLATVTVAVVANSYMRMAEPIQVLILAALIAGAGILGDLWESAIKREATLKDSGYILPGHGGILDRFDSLLFAVPVVYYYLQGFIID